MKKFLAIYIGTAASLGEWQMMDEATRKTQEKLGMDEWKLWAETNKKSIVDGGAPLGKTKRISMQGIADMKNEMAAYVIIEAESHEAAAQLFENHPHFMLFPGDSVEVMECLPLPTM